MDLGFQLLGNLNWQFDMHSLVLAICDGQQDRATICWSGLNVAHDHPRWRDILTHLRLLWEAGWFAKLEALKAAGATTIYREKVSGVRADRPQLAKLMAKLEAGDVVIVTKLDRLGRSTRELLELIDRVGKQAPRSDRWATRSGTLGAHRDGCYRRY